jgi:predicted nucleic acid-binding protein
MQTSKLFVDTSGWMAYLVVGESQHAQAVQEIDHALDDASIAIYTTDHILAELVALMQARRLPRAHILRDVNGLLIAPKIIKL